MPCRVWAIPTRAIIMALPAATSLLACGWRTRCGAARWTSEVPRGRTHPADPPALGWTAAHGCGPASERSALVSDGSTWVVSEPGLDGYGGSAPPTEPSSTLLRALDLVRCRTAIGSVKSVPAPLQLPRRLVFATTSNPHRHPCIYPIATHRFYSRMSRTDVGSDALSHAHGSIAAPAALGAEEKSADEKTTGDESAEGESMDEKTEDKDSVDETTVEEESAEGKSMGEQTGDEQSADEKTGDEQAADGEPTRGETAGVKATDEKIAEEESAGKKREEGCNCSADTCCCESSWLQDPLLKTAFELDQKITAFLEAEAESEPMQQVQRQTEIALGVVKEALDRYSLNELSISYNGGKDCLVILILFLVGVARLARRSPHAFACNPARQPLLHSVYVMSAHPFQEVDDFVDISVEQYKLDLARYALPMKLAFETYLQEKPNIKAIFVGTRRTDPHGEFLTHFDITDHGWPRFMRIHPVIDWHYQDVWVFLRHLNIPYCSLYDKGYTSLGGTTDTLPNPALLEKNEGSNEEAHFRPAYELIEDEQERLGRNKKKK